MLGLLYFIVEVLCLFGLFCGFGEAGIRIIVEYKLFSLFLSSKEGFYLTSQMGSEKIFFCYGGTLCESAAQ